MKHYETMFVLKPTLTQEEIKARVDGFKELLIKNGAKIEAIQDMGARTLAYEIQKHKRGYYFVIYFMADSSTVLELERIYTITEDVIRFIIIKFETKKDIAYWQYMADKANGKPAQPPMPKKVSAPKPKSQDNQAKEEEQKEEATN